MSNESSLTDLRALINLQSGVPLATDDVVFLVLPLMQAVALLHSHGRVALLGADDVLLGEDRRLGLRITEGRLPQLNLDAVKAVQPQPGSALNIIGEHRLTVDSESGAAFENLQASLDEQQKILRPVFLPEYTAWELKLGHHDEITDIFCLGQILASLSCGLDFDDAVDLKRFVENQDNLFRLNDRLNPVMANIIVEMTALNRHNRATDLSGLAKRLETYRDQPVGLDVERVLRTTQGAASRRAAVLAHLRDRLFDLSRRNRLLYFRPTQASINLTVASVPLVLQLDSIRIDQLCIWTGNFAKDVLSGNQVGLQQWLRFDDQLYLPASLDRILQETRRDRAEYGFSHLRLVIGFLRWNNLKESPDERILSPLLWLPVELSKKKGVRDQYVLQCDGSEAEFNPALRHQLRQLYDIKLPETVDLSETTIDEIHADLVAQIQQSEPGVELRLLTKPAIELIHQKAVQRMQQFKRRRGREQLRTGKTGRPAFSYEPDDYRPLGLALFRQKVSPSELPLRGAVGAAPTARPLQMVAQNNEIESATFSISEDRGHRYAWDFDLTQVTLSNFNYKKMSLVRDYSQLIEEGLPNPALDRVFSIEPRAVEIDAPEAIPLSDRWNVVAGDATQNAAISLARSGRSFIIQGPPGTGKSQTITNLIADYAGRGQRVLFVCEKRAALDVVFYRLKQSGLADLCCLIHDSQTDKKAFVANLRDCYEGWVSKADNLDLLSNDRSATMEKVVEHLERIKTFEQAMLSTPETLACSVRVLIRRALELPRPETGLAIELRERLPDFSVWQKHRDLTTRLYRFMHERFGAEDFATHPFAKLSSRLLAGERAIADTQAVVDECESLLDQLDSTFDNHTLLLNVELTLRDALALTESAKRLVELKLADKLDLTESESLAAKKLIAERSQLNALHALFSKASAETTYWREPLSSSDTLAALDLATTQEHSVMRWLKPAWWKLRSELQRRYDFSKHVVRPAFVTILGQLRAAQQAKIEVDTLQSLLKKQYGINDLTAFFDAVDSFAGKLASTPILQKLRDRLKSEHDSAAAARREALSHPVLLRLSEIVHESLDLQETRTLSSLGTWLRDLREDLGDLPDMLPLLRAIHQSHAMYVTTLQTVSLTEPGLEAIVVAESLARVLRQNPELASFDARALTISVQTVARGEALILDKNADVVTATIHRLFHGHIRKSAMSVTQLSADERQFKKSYSTGRRELEHEFGKSMRFNSIRELSGGDSGLVINDLKPIWLMSPLSVSDTLPLSAELFDVVIFDEASQIPTEEAVPALSRAQQVIVVGDEMQLPPTTFFSTRDDDDDNQIIVEEEGTKIAINLDADSFLNQAARNLPATLLAWHYRSRHEALISFSNAAFYDGRLVTIPERKLERGASGLLIVDSKSEGAAVAGAAALQERAVSFHKVQDGVYIDRCNLPEANYIAQLVRQLLMDEKGMSIGVVAFSEAQQTEIESALETLAAGDDDFATRLEREYVREDDDQFNGLFVKNLENVQGDERDIILLSICYAPGPDGRMLMNFGPINQRGGEKRLNVIFSRARHRMAVISSIQADAIKNTHNDGAAALKAFLQFAEASAHGETERSQAVLSSLNPGAQRAFSAPVGANPFSSSLANALRKRGHEVHEHVGRSKFRCDLAIKEKDGDAYALAILLDSDNSGSPEDIHERYVFRPTILRAFAWKVIDIPSAEWLKNPGVVIDRIEAALTSDDGFLDVEEFSTSINIPISATEAADEEPNTAVEGFSEFLFQQGSSNKFWRIGQSGNDVTVVFGRVGTKGQSVIKNFDSPERAAREVAKLTLEKINKGYIETSRPVDIDIVGN
jgi:predicted DNA-binding WGR domain protein